MTNVENRCLQCDIIFFDRARYDRIVKYCSRECFAKAPRPDKANRKICIKCQYPFRCKPSKNQKHCSSKCAGNAENKILLNCLICSQEFYRNPSSMGKYCSPSCAGKLTPEQQIESLKYRYEKFVIKHDDGCWDWIGSRNMNNYGQLSLTRVKPIAAHRASWIIHNGPIPKGAHVLHKCDNPPCTRPSHLTLGDHKENMRQMSERKRSPKPVGELSSWAKLTEIQVRGIKQLLQNNERVVDVARKYNVSETCISAIKNGKNWKHVILEEKI